MAKRGNETAATAEKPNPKAPDRPYRNQPLGPCIGELDSIDLRCPPARWCRYPDSWVSGRWAADKFVGGDWSYLKTDICHLRVS